MERRFYDIKLHVQLVYIFVHYMYREHDCVWACGGEILEARAAFRTVDDLFRVGLEVGAHEDALGDALREVKALV